MLRPVSRVLNKGVIETLQNKAWRVLASDRPVQSRHVTTATAALPKNEVEEAPDRPMSTAQLRSMKDEQCVIGRDMSDPCSLTYHVGKMITPDKVHINLEDLSSELHEHVVKHIMNDIVQSKGQGALHDIQFNHVSESAFRYCLNMPLRSMGYKSTFTKYNHERGLACFERLPDKTTLTSVGQFSKSPCM